MKLIILQFYFIYYAGFLVAQSTNLPIKEWHAVKANPFILYISGDGGLNHFSTGFCNTFNQAGYSITALNSRTYFWDKKTPVTAAAELAEYVQQQLNKHGNAGFILIGYSFGADVLPFIVNQWPASLRKQLQTVILLSPSVSTDFEVHLSDMLGNNKKRSMNVIAAINQLGLQKTVSIFGSEEKTFPVKQIVLKNYVNVYLPGGHHFDENQDELVKTMISYFK